MAETQSPATLAPVTEESLLAERMSFWASFTSAGTGAAAAVVVLVILLWVFLV